MEGNLLALIPVLLLFAGAFGLLLRRGIKEWRKTDKEIISEYLILAASLFGNQKTEIKTLVQRLLATVVFVVFFLFKEPNHSPAPYIFCGIVLLISGFPLLGVLLGRNRETNEEQAYRQGALVAVAINLAACCFFCFFIGIGTRHGVWWFVSPPGLIFLVNLSRPLVAGIRLLIRKEKDPGEKHIKKCKTKDPWDRPDRKL
jgi:cytochrome c oxidase assembly factor CtaG